MSYIEKVVEAIRCGYPGERMTSGLIARVADIECSIASASMSWLVKRCNSKFIRPIARLNRDGRGGRPYVVYEIVNPRFLMKYEHRFSGRRRILDRASPSYTTHCELPFIPSIDAPIVHRGAP